LHYVTTKAKQNHIHVIRERCKGCSFCVEFCPQHILYQTTETNAKGYQLIAVADLDRCTGCGMCSRVCPEFAIFVETPDGKQ
jgi:2-oxoglutarate ferredoxin oxidoreductase subunit delta